MSELCTLKGHSSYVYCLAFSPGGKLLASGSDDKSIRVWDLEERMEQATLTGNDRPVRAVAFYPDGKTLLSGEDANGFVRVWDVASEKEIGRLEGHTGTIRGIAVATEGSLIATADEYGKVFLWDAATRTQKQALEGLEHGPTGFALSANGQTLAACDDRGNVTLWAVARGKLRVSPKRFPDILDCVAVSPDGKSVAAGNRVDKALVKVWDVASGEEKAGFDLSAEASCLSYSADGKLLAVGTSRGEIILADAATGAIKATLTGHYGQIYALAFSPVGATLASGAYDQLVKVWNAMNALA